MNNVITLTLTLTPDAAEAAAHGYLADAAGHPLARLTTQDGETAIDIGPLTNSTARGLVHQLHARGALDSTTAAQWLAELA